MKHKHLDVELVTGYLLLRYEVNSLLTSARTASQIKNINFLIMLRCCLRSFITLSASTAQGRMMHM